MAGPSLEMFRFAMYLAFPIGYMLYFGDPAWYERFVMPYRERYMPPETDFDLRASLQQQSILTEPAVTNTIREWKQIDKERLI
ncbi:hypothetical protein MCUN1_003142 [Malassezia cuniculi]|uniref:Protein PET100, mitochondrial n=1 Tax=Malassezia cuniculi TaxID=948313 RepID=A0AAF0EW50_9BASI|nr:hypothetical protein MCUN1_003142 [Malassezia cuniculi]